MAATHTPVRSAQEGELENAMPPSPALSGDQGGNFLQPPTVSTASSNASPSKISGLTVEGGSPADMRRSAQSVRRSALDVPNMSYDELLSGLMGGASKTADLDATRSKGRVLLQSRVSQMGKGLLTHAPQ